MQMFNTNLLHNIYIYWLPFIHVSTISSGHLQGATCLFDIHSFICLEVFTVTELNKDFSSTQLHQVIINPTFWRPTPAPSSGQ